MEVLRVATDPERGTVPCNHIRLGDCDESCDRRGREHQYRPAANCEHGNLVGWDGPVKYTCRFCDNPREAAQQRLNAIELRKQLTEAVGEALEIASGKEARIAHEYEDAGKRLDAARQRVDELIKAVGA